MSESRDARQFEAEDGQEAHTDSFHLLRKMCSCEVKKVQGEQGIGGSCCEYGPHWASPGAQEDMLGHVGTELNAYGASLVRTEGLGIKGIMPAFLFRVYLFFSCVTN